MYYASDLVHKGEAVDLGEENSRKEQEDAYSLHDNPKCPGVSATHARYYPRTDR